MFVPTKRLKGKSYREAANDKEVVHAEEPVDITSDTEEPVKKYPGPSGLMVEVVIPVHEKSTSSTSHATTPATTPAPSSSGAESDMSDEESDALRARKGRGAAKKYIIISDDESDDEDIPPVKSRKAAPAKKSHKKGKASSGSSSDYEDEEDYKDESESAEGTTSDSDSVQASDSDELESKTKAKKKAPAKRPAPKRGKKQSLPSSEASEEDMAVDDLPKAKASGKKRKAEGDGKEKPAKKQKRREETDPWKLESAGVKRDWTQMQAPPLEMFHFSRIVVDEYTYLDGKTHSMVTRQSGDRKWVLSGTVSYSPSHFILKA